MAYSVIKTDSNGNSIGLAPQAIETIVADTEIDWRAITPATDVDIYFTSSGASATYSLLAGTTILVHPTLRLATQTVCMVY